MIQLEDPIHAAITYYDSDDNKGWLQGFHGTNEKIYWAWLDNWTAGGDPNEDYVMRLDKNGNLWIKGKLTQAGCPDYSNITPLEFIQESINKIEHTTQEEVDALMHVIIEQDEQIKKLTEQIEVLEVKIALGVKKDK